MSDRIVIIPDVCNGKPVIKGTRITVSSILGYLSGGDTIEGLLEEFPQLERDDVLACLAYAQHITDHRTTVVETAS